MISGEEIGGLAARTSVARVSSLLPRAGWEMRGGREGLFVRWEHRQQPHRRLIVPLDQSTGDYEDLMHEVVLALFASDTDMDVLVRRLDSSMRQEDELRFVKDAPAVAGAVSWPDGRSAIDGAEETILAGAKAKVSRRSYFGGLNARFARRFLASCYMGQTEVGSYVVKAFAPTSETFFEKESETAPPGFGAVGSHLGRDISLCIATALESAYEATTHYMSTQSLSGFDAGIQNGVSRELTLALQRLVQGADESKVHIEWIPPFDDVPIRLFEESPRDVELTFSGAMRQALESATKYLEKLAPVEYVTATGWVRIVERPKRGQSGVIRLKIVAGSEAKTLRIPLSEEQFETAAQAISRDALLTVSGRQYKERRTYHLSDASNVILRLPYEEVSGDGSAGSQTGPLW